MYNKLYKESTTLMNEIRSEGVDVPVYIITARKIFYGRTKKHPYTGLSWMFVRDSTNASRCLKFMIQQQKVYLILYNMHFSVTLNRNEASSFMMLSGPSETGKSWAMKKLTTGIADCLTRVEDSASDQAGTIDDSGDLQVGSSCAAWSQLLPRTRTAGMGMAVVRTYPGLCSWEETPSRGT